MTVLTLDLGTSATKAALWDDRGLVALARGPIVTVHPAADRAEQDPRAWWDATAGACSQLRAAEPGAWAAIDALGFSAARGTFALFDEMLEPLGPGILWSDARAGEEAAALGDAAQLRAATGVVPNGESGAAKVAWVARHEPERFAAARWVLAPRDWVAARLTGTVHTDRSLASRTGWYRLDGTVVGSAALAPRLPPVVASATVVGEASGLGLPPHVPVVLGAGDRACEVLGAGAGAEVPMVSWGTTTNLSVPHPGPSAALPATGTVSAGALGDFVVEAGLSAGGAAIQWVAGLTGRPVPELLAAAAAVPPGADGLLALPWLHGARAPWWQPSARGAFTGITTAHGPAELARAVVEAVALDVARCLELVAPETAALTVAGGGAGSDLWRSVLAAATARPLRRRAVDDAASVGARLVVAVARGEALTVDRINEVVATEDPDEALVDTYGAVRAASDAAIWAALSPARA